VSFLALSHAAPGSVRRARLRFDDKMHGRRSPCSGERSTYGGREMHALNGHRGVVIMAVLALAVTAVVAGDHVTCTKSAGECAAHMKQMYQTRGWMGVELEQNEDGSLRVTAVVVGSPAEKAGVRLDDTLVSVNGVTLSKDTT